MAEEEPKPQLRLVTTEGAKVNADVRLADMCALIKNITDDSGILEEIPLPSVTEPILRLIMAYCDRQNYVQPQPIKKPLASDRIEEAVTEPWHAEFINNMTEEVLTELTMATNYMDSRGLFDLCCAKIATMFKGKTVEELKARYNLTEDLTPEMEEKILKENPWITSDSATA
jgi:S-phase kinase-associated protein 1